MRNSMISSFPSLPARAIPLPWEDLASLISRVAVEMGYKNPGWILRPEELPSTLQPYNLCLLRRIADYQFLEHLLCMDEETIYGLTLHRFASRLQEPEGGSLCIPGEVQRMLLTRYIFQTFLHPYSSTKVCSACLADEPIYARLYWSALPVVTCLHHRIFLTDRCPDCHHSIPLLRTSLVSCPRCKGDYRKSPAVPMMEDPCLYAGQTLILQSLGVEWPAPESEAANSRMSPLFALAPWQYFLLLDAFRCIIGPLFPDAPFLRVNAETRVLLRQRPRPQSQFSLLEWSVAIATIHSLFMSWPDNFFTFLDAFPLARSGRRRKRDRQRATGLHRDFGVFYEKWLYKRLANSAFAFLHEAFETYLSKFYTGGEVTKRLQPFKEGRGEQLQERPYLTKGQTKLALGIGEDVLQALLAQDILHSLKKPIGHAGKRTMFLIDRSSIETVCREWAGLLPLEIIARSYLGVTKGVMLMLEQAGLLMPTRGPYVDGYKLRLYSPAVVAQFEETLLSHAEKAPAPPLEAMIPLPVFASKAGMPLVALLEEILEGRLVPIEIGGDQPLLRRLVLPYTEIAHFLVEYKRRQREKWELLTPDAVALDLGISERVLRRWARWKLIEGEKLSIDGKKPSLLFRKQALEDFRRTYAFTEEVAGLLGVTSLTVGRYVRNGKLHPVVGRRMPGGGTRLLYLHEEVLPLTEHSDAKDESEKLRDMRQPGTQSDARSRTGIS